MAQVRTPQTQLEDKQSSRSKATNTSDVETHSSANGLNSRQQQVLNLQRTVGNAAVRRMLAAKTVQREEAPYTEMVPEGPEAPGSTSAATSASAGNDGRYTTEQFLNKVTNPTAVVMSPSVSFMVDGQLSTYPAKIQSF